MMSQHGYQPSFRNPVHSDGTMDLYIETLTGTAFEITVNTTDTVMSIKSKIQRVEGIPISHQHLLYNMHELDDSACLIDYSIQDGATLKLVLSMRGGPISTRRLPLGEELAWKDQLRELVEGSREEVHERLPPGARVTVFVFGEGNQLNLVRVIENDDGSYTPLSESWSGSSIRNLFAEEDADESTRRLQENSVTMGKMQDLQHKMETLTIQKKPKNPSSDSLTAARPLLSRRVSQRNLKPNSTIPIEPSNIKNQPNLTQLPSINTSCELPSTSRLHPTDNYLATSSLLQTQPSIRPKEYRLSRRETKPEASGRRPGRGGGMLPEIRPKRSDELARNPRERKRVEADGILSVPHITIAEETSIVPSKNEASSLLTQIPRDPVTTKVGTSGRYRLSRFVLEDTEDRPKTSPDNLTKQQKAAQEICDILSETKWHRHTRQSRIPCGNSQLDLPVETQLDFGQGDFVHKERSIEDSALNVTVRSPQYGRRSLPLPLIDHNKPTKQEYHSTMLNDDDSQPRSRKPSEEVVPEQCTLPAEKKQTSMRTRCAQCKKRLNITNIYTCRCNQSFCSAHRHCEAHECTFDYKTHGRKLIQAANPVVSAPKLDKI